MDSKEKPGWELRKDAAYYFDRPSFLFSPLGDHQWLYGTEEYKSLLVS